MKKLLLVIFFMVFLFGCMSSEPQQENYKEPSQNSAQTITSTAKPTMTITPTPIITETPKPTLTPTLTPTIKLPAQENTPIPISNETITIENASKVETLARWGKGFVSNSFHFPEWEYFVVESASGLYIYDTTNFHEIGSVRRPGYIVDLNLHNENKIDLLVMYSEDNYVTNRSTEGKLYEWDITNNSVELSVNYTDLPCWLNWRTRLSPDGERFICRNESGDFYLVNVQNQEDYSSLENPGHGEVEGPSFEFTADGEKVMVFYYDSMIWSHFTDLIIWDVSDSQILGSIKIKTNEYAVSTKGDSLALLNNDNKEIQFYSLETLEKTNTIILDDENITEIKYSFHDDEIITSSYNGTISIWDIESGEKIALFQDLIWDEDEWHSILYGHDIFDNLPYQYDRFNLLSNIFFSENDENIIALNYNHQLTKWSIREKKLISQSEIQAHLYTQAILFNNYQKLAFGDEAGRIEIWDLLTNQLIQEINHDKRILWIIDDPTSDRIIFGDGYQEYGLDLSSYAVTNLSEHQVGQVIENKEKSLIAGYKSGTVKLIDKNTMTSRCQINSRNIQFMQFSPNGKFISLSDGYKAQIWDVNECQISAQLNWESLADNISFTENGNYFMTTNINDSLFGYPVVYRWDTENWKLSEKIVLDSGEPTLWAGKFSFCGNFLLLDEGLYKVGEWDALIDEYDSIIYYLSGCNEKLVINQKDNGYFEILGIQ